MPQTNDIKYIVARETAGVTTITFGPFDSEAEAQQWGNNHYGRADPNWGILELHQSIREEHACYL